MSSSVGVPHGVCGATLLLNHNHSCNLRHRATSHSSSPDFEADAMSHISYDVQQICSFLIQMFCISRSTRVCICGASSLQHARISSPLLVPPEGYLIIKVLEYLAMIFGLSICICEDPGSWMSPFCSCVDTGKSESESGSECVFSDSSPNVEISSLNRSRFRGICCYGCIFSSKFNFASLVIFHVSVTRVRWWLSMTSVTALLRFFRVSLRKRLFF